MAGQPHDGELRHSIEPAPGNHRHRGRLDQAAAVTAALPEPDELERLAQAAEAYARSEQRVAAERDRARAAIERARQLPTHTRVDREQYVHLSDLLRALGPTGSDGG